MAESIFFFSHNLTNKMKFSIIQSIKKNPHDFCMYSIIIFYTFFLFLVGCSRHYGFLTSINDLGHFDQAIWGASKNGILLNTDVFNYKINRLGIHFDPILYAFSPFYKILPSVNWLILAQAFSLSISAWPIYKLAGHYSQEKSAGIFWSLAYLINPFLLNAATWDFHPIVLAVPFVGLAALATEKKDFFTLLIACFFILLCKEHFGLMVGGFGLLWGIRHREYLKSFTLVCLGAFHFILIFHYVMPSFSPTGTHVMMTNDLGQLSRYNWLGNSISEIIQTLLRYPIHVMTISLFEIGGIAYLLLLILPFVGLPILGAFFLIPAMGDLTANILSSNPMPRDIYAYHSVAIIPLICAAAIKGSSTMLRWRNSLSPVQLAGFVFSVSLIFGYILTALPLPGTLDYWAPKHLITRPDQQLKEVQKILGPKASLSVQANVGPHFSQRDEIFTFPNKVGEADFLVLRLDSPTNLILPHEVVTTGTLASHLQLGPNQYLTQIHQILEKNQYGIFYWKDPWLVLKKGQKDKYPRTDVESKISGLKISWNYE